MSFIGKRSIDSITIGGQTINGGAVEINMPGSSVDPVTGEITLPTSAGKNIDEFTLDATDISNEYVLVAVAITSKNQTTLAVDTLAPQYYGTDFIVTDDDGVKRVSWSGLGLASLLEVGDKITIMSI